MMYEAFKLDDKQVIQERWGKIIPFLSKNPNGFQSELNWLQRLNRNLFITTFVPG